MLLAAMLLATSTIPPELPAFDQTAILQRCAREHGDNLDGQYECLTDEMKDHHMFRLLWTQDRPENREQYRRCLVQYSEEGQQPDWGMANFCVEGATAPAAEAAESGGAFSVKAAQAVCTEDSKDRPSLALPGGGKPDSGHADCMAYQAAGHRSFRLLRAQVQKGADSADAKALEYCYQNWVKDENANNWQMANHCAQLQFLARIMLKKVREE